MEHNPFWEANSTSGNQESPRVLWNSEVHYYVHKGLPLVPLLSQTQLVHTLSPYFPKIHSNTKFPLLVPRGLFPLLISNNHFVHTLIPLIYGKCCVHLIFLEFVGFIVFGEVYKCILLGNYSSFIDNTVCILLFIPWNYINSHYLIFKHDVNN